MSAPDRRLIDTPTFRWIGALLLSGVAILGVLPLGMSDILNPFIPFFSITHLLLLLTATTAGLLYLYQLATGCRWPRFLTGCALIPPLAALFVFGRLPTTDSAALSTYLAIPKWWLDSGAIVPFLWYAPSLQPNLVEIAFVELLTNSLERLIPVYLTCFLICLATLTARFVEHRTHRKESACLAFLLSLAVPIALRSATVPWPNLPAALFVGIALVLIIEWLEDCRRRSLAILAGISLGLGVGCSPDAIVAIVAILPALLCAARAQRIEWWQTLGSCARIGGFAILLCTPWLARNGLWLGNPFYPLGGDLFGTNALIAGRGASLDLSTSLITLGDRWREFLLTPFVMALLSHDGPSGVHDGVASPLFLLALIPMWIYRKHPSIIFCGLFIALFFLCSAIGGLTELRHFLPLFLPVSVLTILGIGTIGRLFKRRYERAAVGFLIAAQVISCVIYTAERAYRLGGLSPRIDDVIYLRDHLPDYRFIEVLNRTVPPAEYVYDLLATSSFLYVTPRIMTGGVDRTSQIEQWLRSSASPRVLAQEFLNRGIRFLAYDDPALSHALSKRATARERELWDAFTRTNLVELETSDSRRLCRIELN